jgi:hypothetical protein
MPAFVVVVLREDTFACHEARSENRARGSEGRLSVKFKTRQ